MRFLPMENITYTTSLGEYELIDRLSQVIEPEKMFRFGLFDEGPTKVYEGKIRGATFDIKNITMFRHSFKPRIKGMIQSEYNGSTIHVIMRPPIHAMVFMVFWCGMLGLIGIFLLARSIGDPESNQFYLKPFGMILFGYALTMAGFNFESQRSKKHLKELFDADILEPG